MPPKLFDHAYGEREQTRRQTKHNGADKDERNGGRRHGGDMGNGLEGVLRAQKTRHAVACKGGNKAIHTRAVRELAQGAHLHAKKGAGKRCAKDAAKGSGDAREHEVFAIASGELEELSHVACDGATNLHGGSLSAGRSACEVCGDGAHKGEACHARMDGCAGK